MKELKELFKSLDGRKIEIHADGFTIGVNLFTKDTNLRYNRVLKSQMISEFKKLYSEYFDLNTIRYIF